MNHKIEDLNLKACDVKICCLSEEFDSLIIEAEGHFFGKIEQQSSTIQ